MGKYLLWWCTKFPNFDFHISTEQNPSWEANKSTASHKIPRIFWNSKDRYRIYNRPEPDQSSPWLPIPILENSFKYYPTIYT